MAKAGRGTHTIVKDNSEDLNGQVIRALSDAMEPSFKGVSYGWNGQNEKSEEELFRNNLVHSTKLCMTVEEFEAVTFAFNTKPDPET